MINTQAVSPDRIAEIGSIVKEVENDRLTIEGHLEVALSLSKLEPDLRVVVESRIKAAESTLSENEYFRLMETSFLQAIRLINECYLDHHLYAPKLFSEGQ